MQAADFLLDADAAHAITAELTQAFTPEAGPNDGYIRGPCPRCPRRRPGDVAHAPTGEECGRALKVSILDASIDCNCSWRDARPDMLALHDCTHATCMIVTPLCARMSAHKRSFERPSCASGASVTLRCRTHTQHKSAPEPHLRHQHDDGRLASSRGRAGATA